MARHDIRVCFPGKRALRTTKRCLNLVVWKMWDDVAQAGYSYDATRKVLDTYDLPAAVKAKCEYVVQNGLGGLIIWESTVLSFCPSYK